MTTNIDHDFKAAASKRADNQVAFPATLAKTVSSYESEIKAILDKKA